MSDVSDLIQNALNQLLNEALKAKDVMKSMVYKDEPIVRRASDLPTPSSRKSEAPVSSPHSTQDPYAHLFRQDLPPLLAKLRQMALEPSSLYLSREELFYRQALLAQTFEDATPYRGFCMHFCPTYQSLTDGQLRGYFTWRTRYFRGEEDETPSPDFYKLRMYEVLHQIGVSDPDAGYKELCAIGAKLEDKVPSMKKDVQRWIRDYVLYYHLAPEYLRDEDRTRFETALDCALHRDSVSKDAFLDGLSYLSSYDFHESRFYKDHPDICADVCNRFFAELEVYYEKHRKTSLQDSLFGRMAASSYILFQNAVFFDYMTHPDFEYRISQYTSYQCRGRWWTVTQYQGEAGKNKELGLLMRSMDRLLREVYEAPYPLRDDGRTPKYQETMLRKIIEAYRKEQEEKQKKQTPRLSFHLGELAAIREASERTMDRLIVEEEEPLVTPLPPSASLDVVAAKVEVEAQAPVPEETPAEGRPDLGLSQVEIRFLQALVAGEETASLLRSEGLMASVVVDAINEKLFDLFSDTVLLFDGDQPELIEDYISELKGWIE